MTVNGRTEEVKSAIYAVDSGKEDFETQIVFYLLNDVLTELPANIPDYAIAIEIPESLLGKTFDLTKPVDTKDSSLNIIGIDGKTYIDILYSEGMIEVLDSSSPDQAPTVTAGSLLLNRSGDEFTVKLSVTLSNGNSLSADWKGTATEDVEPA